MADGSDDDLQFYLPTGTVFPVKIMKMVPEVMSPLINWMTQTARVMTIVTEPSK